MTKTQAGVTAAILLIVVTAVGGILKTCSTPDVVVAPKVEEPAKAPDTDVPAPPPEATPQAVAAPAPTEG